MNKIIRSILLLGSALSLLAGCVPVQPAEPVQTASADWVEVDLSSEDGFERAESVRKFSFPGDHGAHETFQTEWWYFTGNLTDESGRRFGYELTFFRRGLSAAQTDRTSAWATSQIYMAHFALTDAGGRQFFARQRFSRAGLDLAGATVDPLARVWLEDWQAAQTSEAGWTLSAADPDFSIQLDLTDRMGPVLQGEGGLSRKGPQNASYYYSLPDLATTGSVSVDGQTYRVSGASWMDHEFSTSALAANQVGWDWFALQLDDGRRLMLFTLRRDDGSLDPYSTAALIQADGNLIQLSKDEFSLTVQDHWTSPHSGAVYPSAWRISIPSQSVELEVKPILADQELDLAFVYWEGAVDVSGTVTGRGYVELTGYAASMQGEF